MERLNSWIGTVLLERGQDIQRTKGILHRFAFQAVRRSADVLRRPSAISVTSASVCRCLGFLHDPGSSLGWRRPSQTGGLVQTAITTIIIIITVYDYYSDRNDANWLGSGLPSYGGYRSHRVRRHLTSRRHTYDRHPAIHHGQDRFVPGLIAICGPNCADKSTLLKVIVGGITP